MDTWIIFRKGRTQDWNLSGECEGAAIGKKEDINNSLTKRERQERSEQVDYRERKKEREAYRLPQDKNPARPEIDPITDHIRVTTRESKLRV